MLIAQMSDPHFLPEDVRVFGKLSTAAFLKRCVAHLNQLELDAVLVTGDLTNDGDGPVYGRFARTLSALTAPTFMLTGNHDDREIMRETFAGGYLPAEGPLCYVVDRFPVRLVALDTLVAGEPYGLLGSEQLAWLDARLGDVPEKPTLVALHHPPFRTGIGHLDRSMLRDAEELALVIGRHPQVERVVCGHVHRPILRRWAGTLVQTAPSIAHQAELAFGEARASWVCEPPAVLLHYWQPEAGLVSHTSMIGEYRPTGGFDDPSTVAAPQASR